MTASRDRPVTSGGRHSAQSTRRPRWRLWTAALVVAGLGAGGVAFYDDLPTVPLSTTAGSAEASPLGAEAPLAARLTAYPPEAPPAAGSTPGPSASRTAGGSTPAPSPTTPVPTSPAPTTPTPSTLPPAVVDAPPPVPAKSGEGRRVVFSVSAQRVWLVRADERVARTYPVSGSKHDNLDPGTYEVFSRSRHATSYDFGSTMEYFVRFTRGENAPIGFHTIPVDDDGELLQTRSELGKPLSSGCVRQWRKDAIALWEFAPVGTTVVVVA